MQRVYATSLSHVCGVHESGFYKHARGVLHTSVA